MGARVGGGRADMVLVAREGDELVFQLLSRDPFERVAEMKQLAIVIAQ